MYCHISFNTRVVDFVNYDSVLIAPFGLLFKDVCKYNYYNSMLYVIVLLYIHVCATWFKFHV